MLPPECPDRIQIAFDDHRLVANAGLILPVTLARHLGLGELAVKAPSTPRFREGRLWGPSCAASGGAMCANWTG